MSQLDLFRSPRAPWNVGRMIGAKAPLKPKHIWAIRHHLKTQGAVRDLAMFNVALDAKLRGCNLVKLRLHDVVHGGEIRQRSIIVQQKTGRLARSKSQNPRVMLSGLGLSSEVGAQMTGCSQAAVGLAVTSVRASKLDWSMVGSRR